MRAEIKLILVLVSIAFFLLLSVSHSNAYEIGFKEDFNKVKWWQAQISWLGNPADSYSVTTDGQVADFYVKEPLKGMIWSQWIPDLPIDEFRYMVVRYKALNVNTQSTDYMVDINDRQVAQASAIKLNEIVSDNQWHTKAVDLFTITKAGPIYGLAVQVQATENGEGHIWLDYIMFTDELPGEAVAPTEMKKEEEKKVEIGWEEEFEKVEGWNFQPAWLSNPATVHKISTDGKSAKFFVKEANMGMKWSKDLPEPIDTTKYPVMILRYRAKNIQSFADYAIWLGSSGGVPQEFMPITLSDLICDERWHRASAELWAEIKSVKQIAIQVQAKGEGNAYLEIDYLAFATGKPKANLSDYLEFKEGWVNLKLRAENFQPIDLSNYFNAKSQDKLRQLDFGSSWFTSDKISLEGIPFKVKPDGKNIVATPLLEKDVVILPIGERASEIYLLLAARFVGEEEPPLGSGKITNIREVERFLIELEYEDGSKDKAFPLDILLKNYRITKGISAYVVAPRFYKPIKYLKIYDRMKNGAFYLAGLTINKSKKRLYEDIWAEKKPVKVKRIIGEPPEKSPVIILRESGATLENSYFICQLNLKGGLQVTQWVNKYVGENAIANPKEAKVFTLKFKDRELEASDFKIEKIERSKEGEREILNLSLGPKEVGITLSANLKLELDSSPELRCSLTLQNTGKEELSLAPSFPVLGGLKVGTKMEDNWYFYPRRGAVINNIPINLNEPYSGFFPLQIMGIYNPSAGGGFYLMTQDKEDIYKFFNLQKRDRDLVLKISYPERKVSPGEAAEIAPIVLGVHKGDWHEALEAYENWLKTWYKPAAPRKRWFREIFNFRQTYVHWWNKIYDEKENKYIIDKQIEETKREFGGCDYLHIYDFGWSPQYGRTGDYDHWEALGAGGLGAFREAIKKSQELGVPVGLYIEGHLVDKNSNIGKRYGEKWQRWDQAGKGMWWPHSTEMFICPNVKDWQDYMAKTYQRVVKEAGVNGMYIDEFGFCATWFFCYNPNHGHPVPEPPLRGERDFTRKVRQAIDSVKPGVAIYTEESPCDFNSQFQDGSFTYAISSVSDEWSPHHLNLYRFALPDFKTFEIIVCDKPVGTGYGPVKKILFNGEGMWIQQPPDLWFSPEAREFIRKMYSILSENADAFTSLNPVPLIETEKHGLFANMFPTENKIIYTFFNSRFITVSGEILKLDPKIGYHYIDLWNDKEIQPKRSGDKISIELEIDPRDVFCLACFPEILKVKKEDEKLKISLNKSFPKPILKLVAFKEREKILKEINITQPEFQLNLNHLNISGFNKIVLKLFKDKYLVDEVVL